MQTLRDTYRRSRWLMPAVALALGGVFLVAQWIGGDPTGGLISFAIMAGFAAILVLLEGPKRRRRDHAPAGPSTSAPARSTWRPPRSPAWCSSP